ncbi:general transcription factor IIH subunit 3-like [Penaeus chinensis]|uniref:general transcription factor IIH subunit 3-like n=1 Tax=Penaeus chinensis TaxID=139456 RepID=UPI001FB81BC7|nr:general transcription factor IIH subunit 3-like [Penaeus chinensis]
MAGEGCLLVMVVDVHPQLALHEGMVQSYLSSCVSFANFHLATSVKNRLAVIAANHLETRFLYPQKNGEKVDRQKDGRLELLSHVDESIMEELRIMMYHDAKVEQTESLISGAIGRGLLYIKRHEREDQIVNKIHARILVIKISSDTGSQYLNYINTYLTAQKINTAIDVCVIGGDCGLLQQGADISGGYYHSIQDVSQLLQSLILMYQPDISVRKRLNAPPPDCVDYRAACFCHRTLVDMGNVCSNCLSVYCKAVPLCSTCNVIFQTDRPLMKLPKKKK